MLRHSATTTITRSRNRSSSSGGGKDWALSEPNVERDLLLSLPDDRLARMELRTYAFIILYVWTQQKKEMIIRMGLDGQKVRP